MPINDLLERQYGYPTITGIRLERVDDQAVVAVEVDGEWYEVIRELAENNFNHFWNPASLNMPPETVDWAKRDDQRAIAIMIEDQCDSDD